MSKIKHFFLFWMALSFAGLVFATTEQAAETPTTFTEGKHYIRMSNDVLENDLVQDLMKDSSEKVQVIEFFSYGCSWCYKLDGPIEEWLKEKDDTIAFQRVPVEFQPSWRTLSKAYYVAVELDQLSKVHQPLFKAIHSDEITSSAEDVLRGFFVAQGVNGEDFDKAFDSFSVNRKHKWANSISQAYKVTAVPTLFVQGKDGIFYTSVRLAGSQEGVIDVAEFLIQKQLQAAQSNSQNSPESSLAEPIQQKQVQRQ